MKKKIFYGCALTVGVLTMPLAADECCYLPQYDDPCCYEVGFEGFYIGGNIGAFTHTAHRNDLDGFLTDNSGWSVNDTNVEAGVQIGYDWQFCNKLFGLVADWNWVNTNNDLDDSPSTDPGNHIRSRLNWFSTIRARLGLTVCDALVYVTLGAAVAHHRTEWSDEPVEFEHHHTKWGWTGGVGTELMLGCNWSLGAEVLYLHFNDDREDFTDGATTFEFGHSDSAWVGRIILNYRFGDLFY